MSRAVIVHLAVVLGVVAGVAREWVSVIVRSVEGWRLGRRWVRNLPGPLPAGVWACVLDRVAIVRVAVLLGVVAGVARERVRAFARSALGWRRVAVIQGAVAEVARELVRVIARSVMGQRLGQHWVWCWFGPLRTAVRVCVLSRVAIGRVAVVLGAVVGVARERVRVIARFVLGWRLGWRWVW